MDPINSSPITWGYGRPWLPQTEPAFAPGRVVIGLSGNDLLIRTELNDAHVMNDSFPFNFPAFKQCDAFEISRSHPGGRRRGPEGVSPCLLTSRKNTDWIPPAP